ncbi:MAG: HU family DNA-binding protein [bacterium]|nr:HU family DNA-binding protein [bacterium]
MTKEQLINAVQKGAKIETKKQAQLAVESVFAAMTKSLARGEEVAVIGFGTFRSVKVAAHSGINPKTRERITIPASMRAKFKAGKALKEAVN